MDKNYFKVSVEYLQRSELLVAASTAEAAVDMVKANVLPETEGFKIHGVAELSDEEKEYILKQMTGEPDDEEVEPQRTLN